MLALEDTPRSVSTTSSTERTFSQWALVSVPFTWGGIKGLNRFWARFNPKQTYLQYPDSVDDVLADDGLLLPSGEGDDAEILLVGGGVQSALVAVGRIVEELAAGAVLQQGKETGLIKLMAVENNKKSHSASYVLLSCVDDHLREPVVHSALPPRGEVVAGAVLAAALLGRGHARPIIIDRYFTIEEQRDSFILTLHPFGRRGTILSCPSHCPDRERMRQRSSSSPRC